MSTVAKSKQEKTPEVPCPHCGKRLLWDTANRWRPFCSERCRMVDLGEWLAEEKRIPGAADPNLLPGDDESS